MTAALGMKALHLLALGRLSEVIDLYDECARNDPGSKGPTDFRIEFDAGLGGDRGAHERLGATRPPVPNTG